jgi:hypothetical protein
MVGCVGYFLYLEVCHSYALHKRCLPKAQNNCLGGILRKSTKTEDEVSSLKDAVQEVRLEEEENKELYLPQGIPRGLWEMEDTLKLEYKKYEMVTTKVSKPKKGPLSAEYSIGENGDNAQRKSESNPEEISAKLPTPEEIRIKQQVDVPKKSSLLVENTKSLAPWKDKVDKPKESSNRGSATSTDSPATQRRIENSRKIHQEALQQNMLDRVESLKQKRKQSNNSNYTVDSMESRCQIFLISYISVQEIAKEDL